MALKLKEDPREWLKFAGASCCALAALALLLSFRHKISRPTLVLVLVLLALAFAGGALRPQVLRLPYRLGMTAGHLIGQVVGRVGLLILFLVVLTPLGWVLRFAGKDLLELRKPPGRESYWHRAPPTDRLDTLF
jgi:hypothetical protein